MKSAIATLLVSSAIAAECNVAAGAKFTTAANTVTDTGYVVGTYPYLTKITGLTATTCTLSEATWGSPFTYKAASGCADLKYTSTSTASNSATCSNVTTAKAVATDGSTLVDGTTNCASTIVTLTLGSSCTDINVFAKTEVKPSSGASFGAKTVMGAAAFGMASTFF